MNVSLNNFYFSKEIAWLSAIIIAFLGFFAALINRFYKKWKTEEVKSEYFKKKFRYTSEIFTKYIHKSIEKTFTDYFIYFFSSEHRFKPFYDFLKNLASSARKTYKNPNETERSEGLKQIKTSIRNHSFDFGIGEIDLGENELINLKLGVEKLNLINIGLKKIKRLELSFEIESVIIIPIFAIYSMFQENPTHYIDNIFIVSGIIMIFQIYYLLNLKKKYYNPIQKILTDYNKRYKFQVIQ